jgi:hypothetical protein
MYQEKNKIKEQNLCKHKAASTLITNHSAFLKSPLCARSCYAQWNTIAPQGVPHIIIIGNCQSQLEIRMAGKITLCKH